MTTYTKAIAHVEAHGKARRSSWSDPNMIKQFGWLRFNRSQRGFVSAVVQDGQMILANRSMGYLYVASDEDKEAEDWVLLEG